MRGLAIVLRDLRKHNAKFCHRFKRLEETKYEVWPSLEEA